MSEKSEFLPLTYEKFRLMCSREFDNGFGDVTELHLDDKAFDLLVGSIPESDLHHTSRQDIRGLRNDITGTMVDIVRLKNKAIIQRPPTPPPTTHEVSL